jgi:hypothetical protein
MLFSDFIPEVDTMITMFINEEIEYFGSANPKSVATRLSNEFADFVGGHVGDTPFFSADLIRSAGDRCMCLAFDKKTDRIKAC